MQEISEFIDPSIDSDKVLLARPSPCQYSHAVREQQNVTPRRETIFPKSQKQNTNWGIS